MLVACSLTLFVFAIMSGRVEFVGLPRQCIFVDFYGIHLVLIVGGICSDFGAGFTK